MASSITGRTPLTRFAGVPSPAHRKPESTTTFRVPLSTALLSYARAGRVPLRYPAALPDLLGRRWGRLEGLKGDLSGAYRRRETRVVRRRGFWIHLDPSDTAYVSPMIDLLGWHELGTSELFETLLRPGSTVVDVGAGIGWFTLLAARRVGDRGRVLAVEPEPASRTLLEEAARQNGFGQVKILAAAAWSTPARVRLHLSDSGNQGAHSVVREVGRRSLEVPALTLDAMLDDAGVGTVDLLKVDVEGAEPEVLEGASRRLGDRRLRNLALEWNPEAWVGHDSLLARIGDRYDAFPYDGNLPFRRLRPAELAAELPGGSLFLRLR